MKFPSEYTGGGSFWPQILKSLGFPPWEATFVIKTRALSAAAPAQSSFSPATRVNFKKVTLMIFPPGTVIFQVQFLFASKLLGKLGLEMWPLVALMDSPGGLQAEKKVSLSYSFGFLLWASRKVTRLRYKYYFCVEFLDGGKWKKHFPVFFSGNMARLMNFMGLLIFPFKWRGAEFPVIHGLEKPKLLHTGTCKLTSTPHVTLKSPLLLQFPYCELCDNDNKQSNYRLMNVLFRT